MSNGRNFRELLEARWDEGKFLCVGLDSQLEKLPPSMEAPTTRELLVKFNRAIIDATKDIVCAYKPNPAFYESHGDEGWDALRETVMYIIETVPGAAIILDAKRGDIANTNEQYARAFFEYLQVDALTVHPYLGREPLEPFYSRPEKGVIVLCHTSNPGAGEIQKLNAGGEPLYKKVAKLAAGEWNNNGNSCVMVGATYPKELKEVREIVNDLPILVAGIGAQEGSITATMEQGLDNNKRGLIVNVARSIIFASREKDFAEVARERALEVHEALKKAL